MGRQPQLPPDGEQSGFTPLVTTNTWHCTPPASVLQVRRASCLACHSGTKCLEAEDPVCDGAPDVGAFDEPAALQPAIASATTSGKILKDTLTNAPLHESVWERQYYKATAAAPPIRSARQIKCAAST